MDCLITVKGDGKGQYGKPKADRTEPLRNFLVFNQVFFPLVLAHLRECASCDPTAVLEAYLDRCRNPPTKATRGAASATFLKHVRRLEKVAAKRGAPVPERLVNECWLRGGTESVLERAPKCTVAELVWAYRLVDASRGRLGDASELRRRSRTFEAIAHIVENGGGDKDMEELIEVAEVMLS